MWEARISDAADEYNVVAPMTGLEACKVSGIRCEGRMQAGPAGMQIQSPLCTLHRGSDEL